MAPVVIAHAGHWIGTLAAGIPVLLVILWILLTGARDRRRKKLRR